MKSLYCADFCLNALIYFNDNVYIQYISIFKGATILKFCLCYDIISYFLFVSKYKYFLVHYKKQLGLLFINTLISCVHLCRCAAAYVLLAEEEATTITEAERLFKKALSIGKDGF